MAITGAQAGIMGVWGFILLYAGILEIRNEFGLWAALIALGFTVFLMWIGYKMEVA